MEENKYSHIKFGFRGEGIEYNNGQFDVSIESTWIDGRRIYLDDLKSRNGKELTEEFKRIWFKEIIEFVNVIEKEKPIIEYTRLVLS